MASKGVYHQGNWDVGGKTVSVSVSGGSSAQASTSSGGGSSGKGTTDAPPSNVKFYTSKSAEEKKAEAVSQAGDLKVGQEKMQIVEGTPIIVGKKIDDRGQEVTYTRYVNSPQEAEQYEEAKKQGISYQTELKPKEIKYASNWTETLSPKAREAFGINVLEEEFNGEKRIKEIQVSDPKKTIFITPYGEISAEKGKFGAGEVSSGGQFIQDWQQRTPRQMTPKEEGIEATRQYYQEGMVSLYGLPIGQIKTQEEIRSEMIVPSSSISEFKPLPIYKRLPLQLYSKVFGEGRYPSEDIEYMSNVERVPSESGFMKGIVDWVKKSKKEVHSEKVSSYLSSSLMPEEYKQAVKKIDKQEKANSFQNIHDDEGIHKQTESPLSIKTLPKDVYYLAKGYGLGVIEKGLEFTEITLEHPITTGVTLVGVSKFLKLGGGVISKNVQNLATQKALKGTLTLGTLGAIAAPTIISKPKGTRLVESLELGGFYGSIYGGVKLTGKAQDIAFKTTVSGTVKEGLKVRYTEPIGEPQVTVFSTPKGKFQFVKTKGDISEMARAAEPSPTTSGLSPMVKPEIRPKLELKQETEPQVYKQQYLTGIKIAKTEAVSLNKKVTSIEVQPEFIYEKTTKIQRPPKTILLKGIEQRAFKQPNIENLPALYGEELPLISQKAVIEGRIKTETLAKALAEKKPIELEITSKKVTDSVKVYGAKLEQFELYPTQKKMGVELTLVSGYMRNQVKRMPTIRVKGGYEELPIKYPKVEYDHKQKLKRAAGKLIQRKLKRIIKLPAYESGVGFRMKPKEVYEPAKIIIKKGLDISKYPLRKTDYYETLGHEKGHYESDILNLKPRIMARLKLTGKETREFVKELEKITPNKELLKRWGKDYFRDTGGDEYESFRDYLDIDLSIRHSIRLAKIEEQWAELRGQYELFKELKRQTGHSDTYIRKFSGITTKREYLIKKRIGEYNIEIKPVGITLIQKPISVKGYVKQKQYMYESPVYQIGKISEKDIIQSTDIEILTPTKRKYEKKPTIVKPKEEKKRQYKTLYTETDLEKERERFAQFPRTESGKELGVVLGGGELLIETKVAKSAKKVKIPIGEPIIESKHPFIASKQIDSSLKITPQEEGYYWHRRGEKYAYFTEYKGGGLDFERVKTGEAIDIGERISGGRSLGKDLFLSGTKPKIHIKEREDVAAGLKPITSELFKGREKPKQIQLPKSIPTIKPKQIRLPKTIPEDITRPKQIQSPKIIPDVIEIPKKDFPTPRPPEIIKTPPKVPSGFILPFNFDLSSSKGKEKKREGNPQMKDIPLRS